MNYHSTSAWQLRIANGLRVRKDWENHFKCNTLEDYFEGRQWKSKIDNLSVNYNPYVINMVKSTIKIKEANHLFQKPTFIVSPAPGSSHWDLDTAVQSSQLKQDVLNTIIGNPNLKFTKRMKLAHKDSYFRFGMIEVGYAADWKNPLKEMDQLKSWEDPDIQEDRDKIVTENPVPINERMYIKRINPRSFVCSVSEETELEDHDWCGYCEYYYTSYLKELNGIKWPKNYIAPGGNGGSSENGGYGSAEYSSSGRFDGSIDDQDRLYRIGKLSKVWHIFDLVAHKRRLLLEDDNYTELWSDFMERLPLKDLRWDLRSSGFYPIPPIFDWLSPQDEINETREQMRSYRRRFTRKFQTVKNMVDEEEKEKFASGPDGVIVEVKEKDAISAIQNPDLGTVNTQDLTIARDEFNIISGTSADARGQDTDRTTATQSKIIDARTQIRESAEQLDFSVYLCEIAREILCQAAERMTEGLWVKYTLNPQEGQPLTEMQINAPFYQQIKAQDLSDGYDFSIEVDVQNATPAAMAQAEQAFVKFVTFVQTNPAVAMSPILIRESAYRFGYRNELVIHQMQQVAVLAMAAQASQQANKQGMTLGQAASGQNADNTAKAQMATPSDQQTEQQVNNQLIQ